MLELIIIPESKYLKVGFSNDKEDSDEIYSRCYEYFECNDILIEANFDFEKIDFSANTTELYFPVGKTNISRINSVDIFTFMHNQEYY